MTKKSFYVTRMMLPIAFILVNKADLTLPSGAYESHRELIGNKQRKKTIWMVVNT